jgi:hypothetical protein
MGLELTRRGFLQVVLAAGTAPAICKASNLMKVSGIIVPEREILLPALSTEHMDLLPGRIFWVDSNPLSFESWVRARWV